MDVGSYWDFLCQGRCGITQIPSDRWVLNGFYDSAPDVIGRSYSKWGGFLDNAKEFDPAFFGLNGREAEAMDPQQRLLLTVTYEAIQDARMPS